jgi:hypothetical protein
MVDGEATTFDLACQGIPQAILQRFGERDLGGDSPALLLGGLEQGIGTDLSLGLSDLARLAADLGPDGTRHFRVAGGAATSLH